MVIRIPGAGQYRKERASLTIELLIAVTILVLAVFPLALSFLGEQKLARSYYYRAVAIEIVDGEMEALVAGGWRGFQPGVHAYAPRAESAVQLHPGRFELTVASDRLRLAWLPAKRDLGGAVIREVKVGH